MQFEIHVTWITKLSWCNITKSRFAQLRNITPLKFGNSRYMYFKLHVMVHYIYLGLLLLNASRPASAQGIQSFNTSNEGFRQRIKAKKYSTLSPSSKEANLEAGFFKPGLVIFDKDGTLVCFHTMWSPWCTEFAGKMTRLSTIVEILKILIQNFYE